MEKKIKTPEEQAYEYAYPAAKTLYRQGFIKEEWLRDMLIQAYMAGHDANVSSQWRDASDYPSVDEDVLVNHPNENGHVVAYYDGEDWYITETDRLIRPTRWMPIPPDDETMDETKKEQ